MTAATMLIAGCGSQGKMLWDDIKTLEAEKTELSMQLEKLQQENTQLAEQVNTLTGLDRNIRLQALSTLEKIQLTNRTSFYDKDNDGTLDTLIVHIQPIDSQQDQIKAVGSCTIELWNLNNSQQQSKLGQWDFDPAFLSLNWGGNIFSSYYRISIPITDTIAAQTNELTLKVTFTDYLSGKILSDQTVITKD